MNLAGVVAEDNAKLAAAQHNAEALAEERQALRELTRAREILEAAERGEP